MKTLVLIGTPTALLALSKKNKGQAMKDLKPHSVILDKVDLLQGMEFKDELVEFGDSVTVEGISGKFIMTTNIADQTT